MLERMREGSQGVVAKTILVVIILSFALAGVSSYLGTSSASAVVTVNGEEITKQSVDQAYQNESAKLQQQYGEQFDLIASNPNFTQQIRAQATQTVVTERLIAQAVEEMGLRVGVEQVKEAIRDMPEFQVDGKFNNKLYLSLLRNNNLTPAGFIQAYSRDLVRMQLLQTLIDSEFVSPLELEQANRLQGQKRVARILNIDSDVFGKTVSVSKDEINDYYAKNSLSFQNPEQVSVEYILLDSNELSSTFLISDEDIKNYYEEHASDFQRTERRKVAHILINGTSSKSKDKAKAILADLKAGSDFSTLAKSKSEDTFSGENGGELDWIERDVMDPAFEAAAFDLTKASPLSDVVESEFGFHIIKLIDVQNQEIIPLAKIKSKVEAALRSNKAREAYSDLYQRLSQTAFEQSENLQDSSDEVGIDIKTTKLFSADKAPSILDRKEVLNQIFDENFRQEFRNSDIIELNDYQALVVRVKDYKEASVKPLAEVSAQITLQLKEQKAAVATKDFVESLVTKLKSGKSITRDLSAKRLAFGNSLTLARYSRDHDATVIQSLFKLPKPKAGELMYDYVATAEGDFAIIELSKVVEVESAKLDDTAKTQLTTVLERNTSEASYQSLITYLLSNAEIVYSSAQ